MSETPAEKHKKEIIDWMSFIISKNPANADFVMKKLYDVIMYIAKSPDNLETIHSLVK